MRSALTIVLLMMIVCPGCTDKAKVPKGMLSKDRMRDIMWDLMQVEEYTHDYMIRDTALKDYKKERTIRYQQVLTLHNTNRAEFNKSLDYYMSRPDLTQAIFDTLSARQNRQREENFRLRAVQDSIRLKQQEQRAKVMKDSTQKDSARIMKARRDSLLSLRPARTGHAPR